mgnify:CR=1 FL=1
MPTRYRRDKHEDADLYMTKEEQKSPARGTQYGREMSQRPAASTSRTISNPQGTEWYDRSPTGATATPEAIALLNISKQLNLSGGQEMELMQNGYTDVGDYRYQIDRSSGEVSMAPKPGVTIPGDMMFGFGSDIARSTHGRKYGQPKSMDEEVYTSEDQRRARRRRWGGD